MSAILLTWKSWPYEYLKEILEQFQAYGYVDHPWRVAAYRAAKIGDRAWLLRQGPGAKIIFGAGHVIGEPAIGDAGNRKRSMMLPVRFNALVDPADSYIISEKEVHAILNVGQVRSQASGITMTDRQSLAFEEIIGN